MSKKIGISAFLMLFASFFISSADANPSQFYLSDKDTVSLDMRLSMNDKGLKLKSPCSKSFASCSMDICNFNQGSVTLTNNTALIAYGISVYNLSLFNGSLSIQSNNCSTLNPGQSCVIVFYADGPSHPEVSLRIQGTNTQPLIANISVNQGPC